jgi:hypothetical protein
MLKDIKYILKIIEIIYILDIDNHSGTVPAIQTSINEFHSVGLYLCSSDPKSLTFAIILSTNYFLPLYLFS